MQPFRNYTLHNRDHSKKLIHLTGYLISESTLKQLSVVEHLVIVYSAFLHDLGMSLTETERDRILQSADFSDFIQDWEELWEALGRARSRLELAGTHEKLAIEREIFQLQEAGLAAYLRPRHATSERYRELIRALKIQTQRPDLFDFRGVSFEDLLVDICVSHNLDVGVLAETSGTYEERFPRKLAIGGAYLNAQFCAAILRLSDIMDFDRERTPRVLFESLGIPTNTLPGAELSLLEWQKHMSVHTLEIDKDEIVVSADSKHPVIEKTIREFCHVIEREIRDTVAVLKRNPDEIAERYQLAVPISVRPHIRSIGYVYKDMSLSLNQSRIMTLLMGERLYASPAAAVRELIQNSIDACEARRQLESDTYRPQIEVRDTLDSFGRRWLEVSDNGLGMDEHVLSEYFLKLGNSYYRSPEFGRVAKNPPEGQRPFIPISRFGIGIVSVFLIGDLLEVTTRSTHSPRKDYEGRTARIEKFGGLVFLTDASSAVHGTVVRIRLSPKYNALYELFGPEVSTYLKNRIVRPHIPVQVSLAESSYKLSVEDLIGLRPDAREVLASMGVELISLDVSRWSDALSGTVWILFAKTEQGLLSHLKGKHYLRLGAGKVGIDPNKFLQGYSGNRVSVNGFSMSLKKIGKVLGLGKNRLALLVDVDVRGDDAVEYDISRDRIVGNGAVLVRTRLQNAIYAGLRDTGVLDRLAPETRSVVETSKTVYKLTDQVFDEQLLNDISKLIPDGIWVKGLHKMVAVRLSISNDLAWRALSHLATTGRVRHPD